MGRVVRIAGACGAYGDSTLAVPQLLRSRQVDYLILDYLSEPVMSAFAKLAAADPVNGVSPDFLSVHVGPHLHEILAQGIRVVSNAGGVAPRRLAAALQQFAAKMGLKPKIIAIDGDDLRGEAERLRAAGHREMFSGECFPRGPLTSVNAYLGAFPIAEALRRGADIVVTGRVVDSALALGPLIHEFGWRPDEYDRLAGGTVAGHLLECGAQVTGGTFTDWRDVSDWADIGFPIGECEADGSVTITKPGGTGGLVSIGTVAEQLLYEVGDPQAYFVPDVTCDFSTVTLEEIGSNRVRVSRATGYPPTATYKVCATYDDGWRAVAYLPIISTEAVAKAERQGNAILKRLDGMLLTGNLGPWRKTHTEIIGAEANFGAHARARSCREVMLRIAVEHEDKRAVDLFARESPCSVMSMSAGSTVGFVQTNQVSRLFMFLLPKEAVKVSLFENDRADVFSMPSTNLFHPDLIKRAALDAVTTLDGPMVPLIHLAWVRSGDKGNLFNVAVIARRAQYLPFIRSALTPEAVRRWYAHLYRDNTEGRVDRFDVPGVHALNFVVHDSLDGGSTASARLDFAAKGMGQQLLEFPVAVSKAIERAVTGRSPRPVAEPFEGEP